MGGLSRVFSANIRPKTMPTPSMTARRTAHPMALLRAALAPPRTASAPPVKKPLRIAFQGSSFLLRRMSRDFESQAGGNHEHAYLRPLTAQSKEEKRPPQTPKFPPRTGARALIDTSALIRRSPWGALLAGI